MVLQRPEGRLWLVVVVAAVLTMLPAGALRAENSGGATAAAAGSLELPPAKTTGNDISWPQCDNGERPPAPANFAVVGVNGGRMYTHNDCLADMYRWASAAVAVPQVYINVNGWKPIYTQAECAPTDNACNAYQYGLKGASYSLDYAKQAGANAKIWWLDVETGNYWNTDTYLNSRVIQGVIDYLKGQGKTLGIYSTPRQFGIIAGNYAPGLQNWTAGAADIFEAPLRCSPKYAFGGGKVVMVQYVSEHFDTSYVCPLDVARRIVMAGVAFN
jgi:hypothetical protein